MVGKRILHYNILEAIGEGGMGVVYLAEDTRLHRRVALKFLPREMVSNPDDRDRLLREARLAASLNHPNVATVYAIENVGDETFLAMEYLPGRTLKDAIEQESWTGVTLDQKLRYAVQIAEGLAAAHRQGIVHRDIKTGNIAVTSDGVAKILDFGIARPQGGSQKTRRGQTPGTVAYMSPEQARGEPVDRRTDIWSYGVVLFELLTGQLPFAGKYEQAVFYAILHEKARPLRKLVPSLPEALEALVARALEKLPDHRFQSTEEVLAALRGVTSGGMPPRRGVSSKLRDAIRHRRALLAGVGVFALVLLAAAWLVLRQPRTPSSDEIVNRLTGLVAASDVAAAFDLATAHESLLQGNPRFAQLQLMIFDSLTVRSRPPGAEVVLRRIAPDGGDVSADSIPLGRTPVVNARIARGEYLMTVRTPGSVPASRIVASAALAQLGPVPGRGIAVEVPLLDSSSATARMVPVPGGDYALANCSIMADSTVPLDEYLIDEREVSNEEYQEFVRQGGYVRRGFWKHPIVIGGKPVRWEDAMNVFVDATQMPGPRMWTAQRFREGRGSHPVTGITWYEAAAYAEFRGKSLPTAQQWEKAARNGAPNLMGIVMPWGLVQDSTNSLRNRANFESEGTTAASAYQTGMSPYGCLNMAGNVKEWLATGAAVGRLAAGGSWRDPYYLYGLFSGYPEAFSADDLGFRCVRTTGDAVGRGSHFLDLRHRTPSYRPSRGISFRSLAAFYAYDQAPVAVLSVSAEESGEWRKERIEFSGSDGETIVAYLFLPKLGAAPYQCVVLDPHSGVYEGVVGADRAVEVILGGHIRGGRAAFIVVPRGSPQRPWSQGTPLPRLTSILYRDRVVRWVRDNRIGIDYLASRGDIDTARIGLMVLSSDGGPLLFPALEPRYRSITLVACGLTPSVTRNRPETNPVNFLPRYTAPTLVLNGRYDEVFPVQEFAMPLYNLLPEPKRLSLLNCGHAPPLGLRVPVVNRWLDETLGSVRFTQDEPAPAVRP